MKIIIVSCTKKKTLKGFIDDTPLGKSWKKNPDIWNGLPYLDNKLGLSECYNKSIEKIDIESGHDDDVVLAFCHDDLYLTDLFLKEKLEKAFETYDVVGVAGSSSFSLKNERVAWHFSPKESWAGFVEHPCQNGGSEQTYMSYFGRVPSQVVVIDGLFIAVKLQTLIANNIRFQEQYKFHLYDTAFCLECLKKDLKIGVVGIHTCHLSHGLGLNSEEYIQGEKLLKEQYGEK